MITRDTISEVLERARRTGVDGAEVIAESTDLREVQVRLGKLENIISKHPERLTLRLFNGGRIATHPTSDISREGLVILVERTHEMLAFGDADEAVCLPDREASIVGSQDLKIYDPAVSLLTMKDQLDVALCMEHAALHYDPRLQNSHGASCEIGWGQTWYEATDGAYAEYPWSFIRCGMEAIAKDTSGMQTAYWADFARHLADIEPPEVIGREAAGHALRQLGGRKIATTKAPVIFDSSTAADLLAFFSRAVGGDVIYQGKSFLAKKLGEKIGAASLTMVDDGHRPKGLGTNPFDGEGIACRKNTVVKDGILQSYLLNSYTARKLGLKSTGNADDTFSVGITNFLLLPGPYLPEEIIRSTRRGLYVTDTMGFGVNLLTGDYSQGARGIWIENGELTYPVEEVTIAGNVCDMLMNVEMVGNDLDPRSYVASPTLKIARMTIAGT